MEFAYEVEGFRLLQGDALQVMRELPPDSFNMIFADPPYFLSNGGFTVHAGKRASVHKGHWDKSRGVAQCRSRRLEWSGCRPSSTAI
jgi:site-specific DNA-methyltransferase (adenine-specific)